MDSAELIETDITNLQAPTFTTLTRGPPEPITKLKWDQKVNLIGQKVMNPMIHICEKCNKPILIYGRLIPCRHVFCLTCGREEDKVCMRCKDGVNRVEQALVGNVFMCTHGGSKYGQDGCRRTYLSGRDLQAHMNHRHLKSQSTPTPITPQTPFTPSNAKDMATMKELYLQQQRIVNAPDLQRHDGRGEGRTAHEGRAEGRNAHEGRVEGRAAHEGRGEGRAEGRPAHEGRDGRSAQEGRPGGEARQHMDPRMQHDLRRAPQGSPQPSARQGPPPINQIPVLTTSNPNLVTVPIQENPPPALGTPPLRFPQGYPPNQPPAGYPYPQGQGPPNQAGHFRPHPPGPFYPGQQGPRYPPGYQGQPPTGFEQNPAFRPQGGQPWPGQQQYYR